MNARQQIALSNPCARARETMHQRYFLRVLFGGAVLSTALTVNK